MIASLSSRDIYRIRVQAFKARLDALFDRRPVSSICIDHRGNLYYRSDKGNIRIGDKRK